MGRITSEAIWTEPSVVVQGIAARGWDLLHDVDQSRDVTIYDTLSDQGEQSRRAEF